MATKPFLGSLYHISSNRLMEEVLVDNPRYPHDILIYRVGKKAIDTKPSPDDDDPFSEVANIDVSSDAESEKTILYQGKGRSYTDTTTNGDGKVESNKRKASIPVRFDEWKEDSWPLDGDTIEVTHGNVKERGTVKDFEPDNNRSVVYWELLRV